MHAKFNIDYPDQPPLSTHKFDQSTKFRIITEEIEARKSLKKVLDDLGQS